MVQNHKSSIIWSLYVLENFNNQSLKILCIYNIYLNDVKILNFLCLLDNFWSIFFKVCTFDNIIKILVFIITFLFNHMCIEEIYISKKILRPFSRGNLNKC